MEGTKNLQPSSLDVFNDYKARKAGLIKALSTDVHKFYQQCNPKSEFLLGLYGLPNGTWEVRPPEDLVPPELPEPALGINTNREDCEAKVWLSHVAIHGDCWLLAVASFLGGRYGFDKIQREKLFDMINEEPTVFEAVTGAHKPPAKLSQASAAENNGSKNQSSDKIMPSIVFKMSAPSEEDESQEEQEQEEQEEQEEEEEEEGKETACGTCGGIYARHEFWICCDICETWFHGKCVKITAAKAEQIKLYKCPTCKTNKPKKTA